MEVKFEIGVGSVTKSVAAMCVSNLILDVKNWSSDVRIKEFSSYYYC